MFFFLFFFSLNINKFFFFLQQQTRVGKFVNEMRRKTNDKDLARRCKNLVRRWKQLVDAATSAAGGGGGGGAVNGEGIAPRPAATGGQPPQSIPPHLVHSTAGNSKPSSPASRPATPSSGKSTLSPSLPSRSRPDTPSAIVSRPNTPLSSGRVASPGLSLTRPGTPGSTGSPLARTAPQDITTAATPTQGNSNSNSRYGHHNRGQGAGGPVATSTPIQPSHQAPSGTTESLLKTNATNKKRRRDTNSPQLPNKKLLLSNDSPDGGAEGGKIAGGPKNGIVPGLLHGRSSTPSRPDSPLTCDKSAISSLSVSGVSRLQRTGTPPSVPSPTGATVSPTTSSSTPSRSASQAVKAEVDRPRDRTPTVRKAKVKTTAELLMDMEASGNLQLRTSEVSNRIARNQIEKEEDPVNVSIVPAGARPRPRRKPGTAVGPPSISEKTLKETKTEMVQKFLQNSVDPQSFERTTNSPYSNKPNSRSRTASPALLGDGYFQNNNGSANTSSDSNENQIVDVETPFFMDDNRFGHIRGDDGFRSVPVIEEDDDPWATLPPLLPEHEIDWSEYVHEPPDRTVTDTDVDRLHTENWEGVNGQASSGGDWVDWTGMHTVSTYNDELFPILPYVDIID